MAQYLLLKSDGETDNPRVGLTSDSQNDGGVLGGDTYTASETIGVSKPSTSSNTFQTTNIANSLPIVSVESASFINKQSIVFSEADILSSKSFVSSSTTLSNGRSTTLSNALRDAFSASTFGNSSSNTTAGGITELVTQADRPADIDTSSVVEAFTESFDVIDQTSIGDALNTVTGDTTVVTSETVQSFDEAIAEPLVAAETAALTSQSANQSFGEAFAESLRANGSTLPTSAVGDTAVTSLGTAQIAPTSPQFEQAAVSIFAFVSPKKTNAITNTANTNTETNAVAITEDAICVPITPTMDIVIQVRSGQLNIEGQFSDSLAASVGTSTKIKLAKTIADTEQQSGIIDSSTTVDAFEAVINHVQKQSDEITTSSVEALTVAAALNSFGSSSTFTNTDSESVSFDFDSIESVGFAEANVDADIHNFVLSEIESTANTATTAESLAETAESLVNNGIADTEVEAAALISQVLSSENVAEINSSVTAESIVGEFEIIDRTGKPFSTSLSNAAKKIFSTEEIESVEFTKANVDGLLETINSSGTETKEVTSSVADGNIEETNISPLEALIQLLFLSLYGKNGVVIQNQYNEVLVENAASNGVKIL